MDCAGLSSFSVAYLILSFSCARCARGAARAETLVRVDADTALIDAREAVRAARLTPAQAAAFVGGALPAALRVRAVPPAGGVLRFRQRAAADAGEAPGGGGGGAPRVRLRRAPEAGGFVIVAPAGAPAGARWFDLGVALGRGVMDAAQARADLEE